MSSPPNNPPNPKDTYTDIHPTYWVFKILPPALHPYGLLARWDRPIGWWLLLLPAWWGLAIANFIAVLYPSQTNITPMAVASDDYFYYAVMFFVGAIAMRGAGCTWNDITDRHLDASVERTRHRPLPSGQVTVKQAIVFMILQCLVGLAVLLTMPVYAMITTLASLVLIVIYPFMKRITHFPQFVLGLTFNWGIWVGYTAMGGTLAINDAKTGVVLLFYIGAIFWTLAYDTLYAFQDWQDDKTAGIKSTAIRFQHMPKIFIGGCYGAMIGLLTLALWIAGDGNNSTNPMAYIGIGGFALHAYTLVLNINIEDRATNLRMFKQNKLLGAVMVAIIIVATVPVEV